MVKVTQGVPGSDAVRQGARHVLFVESQTAAGFDVPVLKALLGELLEVKPLGASFSVKSVAEALHPHHPDYYFLVDRDHHDDAFVEGTWRSFPDPNTKNLLVWRRRELESYFLDTAYLERLGSDADENPKRTKTRQHLDHLILREAAKRLYLDAANQVIVEVREHNKANWIEFFDHPAEFATAKEARRRLVEHKAFEKKRVGLRSETGRRHLGRRFDEVLNELTGGATTLELGRGNWIERVRPKPIWKAVANQCFRVVDREGRAISGAEKAKQVALALVQLGLDAQPADFQELHRIVSDRVG
jgi:hypothetical protein